MFNIFYSFLTRRARERKKEGLPRSLFLPGFFPLPLRPARIRTSRIPSLLTVPGDCHVRLERLKLEQRIKETLIRLMESQNTAADP